MLKLKSIDEVKTYELKSKEDLAKKENEYKLKIQKLDADLSDKLSKIEQERIKNGSGEHMRKPGSKGAPTAAALKASQTEAVNPAQQAAIAIAMKKAGKKFQNEEKQIHTTKHFKNSETSELQSKNPNDPDSRFDGTTSGANVYKSETPGQNKSTKIVKKLVKEIRNLS
jgi:hypothetical protein